MITSFLLEKGETLKTGIGLSEVKEILKDEKNLLWLDFLDPSDEDFKLLEKTFSLHSLVIEDCRVPQEAPKVNEFPDYISMIMHSVYFYKDKEEKGEEPLSIREMDVILGKNYILTLHKEKIWNINTIMEQLEKNPRILSRGCDFLLYSILDDVMNNYFYILDLIEDRIDDLEATISTAKSEEFLDEVFSYKRHIISLRKVMAPQRELIARFCRKDYPFVHPQMAIYYKDIHDHLTRIHSMIETFRELLTSVMEAHLSLLSHKMTDVIKVLTIVATIFMPLTFLTGVYGMNFLFMPELKWRFGYLFAWGIISLTGFLFYFYCRKRKWF